MLFLLGAVLLSNLGAWASPVGMHGVLANDVAGRHAAIDLVQMMSAGQSMPDRTPQDLSDDAQCVLEDNTSTADQTLGLPEYFFMVLHSAVDARLSGHASELPNSSLALELRPPIV
jgi:hypothetical protein